MYQDIFVISLIQTPALTHSQFLRVCFQQYVPLCGYAISPSFNCAVHEVLMLIHMCVRPPVKSAHLPVSLDGMHRFALFAAQMSSRCHHPKAVSWRQKETACSRGRRNRFQSSPKLELETLPCEGRAVRSI